MSKLTAILIDDEQSARDNLRYLLNKYCPEIEILKECSYVDEAKIAISEYKPDVVFLDIEMPGKNGFHLLREIPNINFQIIFVTAYDTFALKAFEVSAVDYLLKPVDIERLQQSVKKANKQKNRKINVERYQTLLNNKESKTIKQFAIPHQNDYKIIEVKNIVAIEADRMYSEFLVYEKEKLQKYIASKKMGHFEKLFAENTNFKRVHRSWIVNTNFIKSYSKKEKEISLQINIKIPVSKSYKDFFEEYFSS